MCLGAVPAVGTVHPDPRAPPRLAPPLLTVLSSAFPALIKHRGPARVRSGVPGGGDTHKTPRFLHR